MVEANPRLIGQFPTLSMIQEMNNEPSILAFHILEYLGINYSLNIEKVNKLMRQPKKGSHLFMHNISEKWSLNHQEVKPGDYRIKNRRNRFQ